MPNFRLIGAAVKPAIRHEQTDRQTEAIFIYIDIYIYMYIHISQRYYLFLLECQIKIISYVYLRVIQLCLRAQATAFNRSQRGYSQPEDVSEAASHFLW